MEVTELVRATEMLMQPAGDMLSEDWCVAEVDCPARTPHDCHTTLGTRSVPSGRYSARPVAIHIT